MLAAANRIWKQIPLPLCCRVRLGRIRPVGLPTAAESAPLLRHTSTCAKKWRPSSSTVLRLRTFCRTESTYVSSNGTCRANRRLPLIRSSHFIQPGFRGPRERETAQGSKHETRDDGVGSASLDGGPRFRGGPIGS